MKNTVILFALLIVTKATLASDISDVAKSLDWESKWKKITNSSITMYVERVKELQIEGLNGDKKDLALKEISDSLNSQLSWANSGDAFTTSMSSACKQSTLNNVVSLKQGIIPQGLDRNKIITKYSACMKVGFTKIMPILQNEIMSFKTEKDSIIEKHKNKNL